MVMPPSCARSTRGTATAAAAATAVTNRNDLGARRMTASMGSPIFASHLFDAWSIVGSRVLDSTLLAEARQIGDDSAELVCQAIPLGGCGRQVVPEGLDPRSRVAQSLVEAPARRLEGPPLPVSGFRFCLQALRFPVLGLGGPPRGRERHDVRDPFPQTGALQEAAQGVESHGAERPR